MIEYDPCAKVPVQLPCLCYHTVRFHAVAKQRLGYMGEDEALLLRADPKVPVLIAERHIRVVAADRLPNLTSIGRAVVQAVVALDGIDARQRSCVQSLSVFTERDRVGTYSRDVGLGLQDSDGLGEKLRVEFVICVQGNDIAAARCADPCIAGGRKTGVGLPKQANPAIGLLRGKPFSDLGGFIGAAVVDYDDLPVSERLIDDARDGRAEVLRLIEARYDDADQRGRIRAGGWGRANFGQRLSSETGTSLYRFFRRESGRMVQHDPGAELVVMVSCGLYHRALFDSIAEETLPHVDSAETALGCADPEVPILIAEHHIGVVAAHLFPD